MLGLIFILLGLGALCGSSPTGPSAALSRRKPKALVHSEPTTACLCLVSCGACVQQGR